ncbi:OmpA family protein [Nautilia lithotrophica]
MKKTLIGLSIAASILAAANYQIGIAGGRTHVNKSNMLDNYDFANFRLGKYLNENSLIRFEYEKSGRILNDKNLKRALLNYEYNFNSHSKLNPYYFIGAGYQWVKGNYKNAYIADLGIGLKYKFTNQLNLFTELRGVRDFRNINTHYSAMIGFLFNFGTNENEPIKSEPQNTQKQLSEPIKNKYQAKPVVTDSDHDGVPNSIDKCPNTPSGVKVDKNGCPLDSDHDGIPDFMDKCPDTPSGIKVNKYGCPVSFNFEIEFDLNSAVIKPEYMPKIKKFAEFLKENPAYKAQIQGYTDNTGNKIYNIVLSQKRAKAVYEALINLGIDKNRLSWEGFGDANPIAPNTTPEGRAKNRRVIAKLYF